MNLIKNVTPFLGKLRLTFEKEPYYTSHGAKGYNVLNKIHFNLGFTKLVSRMYPTVDKEKGKLLDPDKVALIELYTGGFIRRYQWWTVKKKDDTIVEVFEEPVKEDGDVTFHGDLPNSFVTASGKYIGDVDRAWWYYSNNLKVCEEHPHGVAIQYKMVDDVPVTTGYYGYTHRGGQIFKIGDKLFNSKYKPVESDYTPEEWAGFKEMQAVATRENRKSGWLMDNEETPIEDVILYTKRGKKVIKTWDDALKAAKNLSKHLS